MHSTSIAETSGANRPGALSPADQRVEHLEQLGVPGADLVVVRHLVVEHLEQRPVALLLGQRSCLSSANRASPGIVVAEPTPGRARPTRPSARRRSPRSAAPWWGSGETAVPWPTPARWAISLTVASRTALAEHLHGGVQQAPAVARGVGALAGLGSVRAMVLMAGDCRGGGWWVAHASMGDPRHGGARLGEYR